MPHITDIACVAGVVCRAKLPDTCQFLWNVLGQKLLEVKRQRLLDVGFLLLRVMPSTYHGLAFCFDCIALTTVCFRATANSHATPSLVREGVYLPSSIPRRIPASQNQRLQGAANVLDIQGSGLIRIFRGDCRCAYLSFKLGVMTAMDHVTFLWSLSQVVRKHVE